MSEAAKDSAGEEVVLTGILDEFRSALQAEIEAANRNAASRAVCMINGRRIGHVGGGFEYLFEIENPLHLPDDSPGDLLVPGYRPLEITVISVEGMAITLRIATDLGAFVPTARLQSNLTQLMRKLIGRIEEHATTPNPVGERIRGVTPVSGEPAEAELADWLEPEQKDAVRSSLGRNATFIWGPPGTGKTLTIGAIGENLFRRGRSLLLVSHTNTAVDQAIIRIGDALSPSDLAAGKVIRVGEPKDPKLKTREELLLSTHVERRSKELADRRITLEQERTAAEEESKRLCRAIDLREWVAEARSDLQDMSSDLGEIHELEGRLGQAKEEYLRLLSAAPALEAVAGAARTAQQHGIEAARLDRQILDMTHRLEQSKVELVTTQERMRQAENLLASAKEIAPSRARAKQLPSLEAQRSTVAQAREVASQLIKRLEETTANLQQAEDLFAETQSVGRMTRLWRGLPKPETQLEVVKQLLAAVSQSAQEGETAAAALAKAEGVLNDVAHLSRTLERAAGIPDVGAQTCAFRERSKEFGACQADVDRLTRALAEAERARANSKAAVNSFRGEYGKEPADVLEFVELQAALLKDAQSLAHDLLRRSGILRQTLEQHLRGRLGALAEWGFELARGANAEAMLEEVRRAYALAAAECEGVSLDDLRRIRDATNDSIAALDVEIQQIEKALKRVEELIIGEAMVVATTLTRAYLRDSIQSRRFDTVILDEASMAPIPALWIAAGLSDANAVVVGDFKQLPPIVLSEHPLARKWLGRDIFEEAGLTESRPPHFVALRCQHRMRPEISQIPNRLLYHCLSNGKDTDRDDTLDDWYQKDWGHDRPLLLVDTGPVHAWVTSVARGRGSSRLDFLSATICVDIAKRLLREDRAPIDAGKPLRVLLASPYRPHAQLTELLIREEGLDIQEVRAGTIHTFQGSEGDVVILDLVNDDPHWRVGMFMQTSDDSVKRLLNVAVTRARKRLIVVGDFDYITKLAKRAFLGREFIPLLRELSFPVSALDIVPVGLAARAARAQRAVMGGDVEPSHSRIVVTQDRFYQMVLGDISRAKCRIVMYSPFITSARLAQLQVHLRSALERTVRVYIVTKALGDRSANGQREYQRLERALSGWGATVIHKRRMHEKLVFIDDDTLWAGSLNPLSFSDTQEVMERRVSREVVRHYAQALHLEDLLKEYDRASPKCPFCGDEVIASEGKDDPFYWRCVNEGCYSRSIDQPTLTDRIACARCGGEVEYGEWGGEPSWRCKKNRHHHQRIVPNHLRLPKMRETIPRRELRKLERLFSQRQYENRTTGLGDQRELDFR